MCPAEEKNRNVKKNYFQAGMDFLTVVTVQLAATFLTFALVAVILNGCHRSQPKVVQHQPTLTPFERDMQYIRDGQFNYVFVFARKDGAVINKEDAAYLRQHAPKVVDWVTTDEGRRVIAGTNFELLPENIDALRQRFTIEDYTGK